MYPRVCDYVTISRFPRKPDFCFLCRTLDIFRGTLFQFEIDKKLYVVSPHTYAKKKLFFLGFS